MLPKEIEGKYAIRGTLGSGAMGTVYDVLDRVIERRVAVKVVRRPPGSDPETEEAHARFRREAQAAGRLAHPNIVGVYDYGENADAAWIVMEIAEGGSLKARLDRQERLPVPEIVRVMEQMLAALAYSHGRGVVHRDIKPANVMLAEDGTVKLADFGIARLENSSMTQIGTVMGTPSYMAPEQLRGETVDARADIWAAGVVLYQLLTGDKPFEGGFSAVMHKAINTEPTPPSQLSVTAPRAFDAVVARALAKRPEDRYPTAAAFAQAIRAAAAAPVAEASAFAGAAPLPGMDSDATFVAGTGVRAPVAPPAKAPARSPAKPSAGGGKRPPVALIAGGVAGVAAVAVAAFLLLGGDGGDAQRRAEELRIAAAREAEAATERLRAADAGRQAEEARGRDAATRTEAARLQAERARQEADQQAAADGVRAAEAARARAVAEAREEQARLEVARRQQTEAARRAAEERAREEATRAEAARAEEERTRQVAARAQAEAAARAREQTALAESAREAERVRQEAERRGREAQARAEAERQAASRSEAERQAAARVEAERQAALRSEAERQAATRAEAERQAEARAEAEREAAARAEALRLASLRVDYRAAAAAAATAAPCSLLGWSATDTGLTLSGVLRRGGEAAIRASLEANRVAPDTARLRLGSFDGPYCNALDLLRPVAVHGEDPPRVALRGTMPLFKGELLRFSVTLPPWPSQLHVSFLMGSGEVAHLVPGRPEAAGAVVALGDPRPGFPGWEVDEPFGTDVIVVLAAERPLFRERRPDVERLEDFLAALRTALRQPGQRVVSRAAVLETAARR